MIKLVIDWLHTQIHCKNIQTTTNIRKKKNTVRQCNVSIAKTLFMCAHRVQCIYFFALLYSVFFFCFVLLSVWFTHLWLDFREYFSITAYSGRHRVSQSPLLLCVCTIYKKKKENQPAVAKRRTMMKTKKKTRNQIALTSFICCIPLDWIGFSVICKSAFVYVKYIDIWMVFYCIISYNFVGIF